MFETDIDILCTDDSAFTNEDPFNDKQIKHQTDRAQYHQQKLLFVLNGRASLLVHAERLDLALNDAIAMTILDPFSPVGYLCAGGIHSRRLQYKSAIRTFDVGLRRVPRSHPNYDRLLHARATAFDKWDRRVDFISKLPLDIVVHNIIPRILQGRVQFKIGYPCDYFDVCRTWRQRMALAKGLHYEIGPESLSAEELECVSDLAPFMRSLAVIQPTREILSKISRRRHHKFNILNKLRVVVKKPYRLRDVLDACPHLVSIRVSCGDIDMASVSKTYPKILKLEVWNREAEVTRDQILSLFPPFPNLRYLKLYPPFGSFILPVIDQHCPLLQQLILTGRTPDFYDDILDIREGNTRGLRVLSVPTADFDDGFTEDDIVQYVMKHSETLEAFGIVASTGFSEPKTLLEQGASQKVTFKRLRQINHLDDAEGSLVRFLLWMIQHVPYLESVETIGGHEQVPIMEELTRPKHAHLKRLGMQASLFPVDEEEDLIQHHIDLGQQSNLKELKIHIPRDLENDSWISLVPQLTQLTTIEFCTNRMDGFKALDVLMPQLADGCPALEKLIMTCKANIMDFTDLYPMDRHRNLKHIVINCEDIFGPASTFCRRFTNIKSLHINATTNFLAYHDVLEKASFEFVFTEILPDDPYFLNDF